MSAVLRVLGLCARATGTPDQVEALRVALYGFSDWASLVARAEEHGVAPLLARHLTQCEVVLPADVRRHLAGLVMRHRRANRIRGVALAEVLSALQGVGVPALTLKGAGLAWTSYPAPELRAMRDLDVLVRRRDEARATEVLRSLGYQTDPMAASRLDDSHHHLPEFRREIDGLTVVLELHRRAGIYNGRVTYDELAPGARAYRVEGVEAQTLGLLDMLWLVYRHGFCVPLRFPDAYRMNSVADLVTLIEGEAVDWDALRRQCPQLVRALPWLHFVTPWSAEVRRTAGFDVPRRPMGVAKDYTGRPRKKRMGLASRGFLGDMRDTLAPPAWWLRVRHGAVPGPFGYVDSWARHVREAWR